MSKVFWDTHPFVYLLEDKGELTEAVVALRKRMVKRGDVLLTSSLTLSELLVKPIEAGDENLARRYEQAILTAASVLPFDQEAASAYARIRQDQSIAPSDAIQLACASAVGVDMFITNDHRLSQKIVPGIQFIQPLSRAVL